MTLSLTVLLSVLVTVPPAHEAAGKAAGGDPVLIGLDAEFGYAHSTSAEAIRQGMLIAVEEINRGGGVLGGRPLAIEERANHSVPARSISNVQQLAAMKSVVAIFCGRFSPTVLEVLPTLQETGLPLLDPWAAADAIIDGSRAPDFAFRLSVTDSWAIEALLREARARGRGHIGMMLLNTSWGRSSLAAAERYVKKTRALRLVGTRWFNWNDRSFIDRYTSLRSEGADAILLVANADEAATLIREVAALPARERIPILSHWGVTGGELAELAGPALRDVDFSVVQTFSFIDAGGARARQVVAAHNRLFGTRGARDIKAPAGVAHAYDLTHLLAKAIDRANTTDRRAIRDALEQLGPYSGLVKEYVRPFTPARHEALASADAFIARYASDGAIVRLPVPRDARDAR